VRPIERLVPFAAVAVAAFSGACATPDEVETSRTEAALTGGADNLTPKINFFGFAQTATPTGTVDTGNAFFASLGVNGRTCNTCHQVGEGWTITPAGVALRFLLSNGTDPLFRPHDAANSPNLDVSTTIARVRAYSLLLTRAVIRIGLPVKPTSEFELTAVDDPYGFASATQLSLFRRPLPITNLRFLSTVNWDGRNTIVADPTNVRLSLKNQANGATVNHAQATMPIADDVRDKIVDFETTLYTAQVSQFDVGELDARGASGGPVPLLTLPFAIGANAPGPGFNPNVFTIYDAWKHLPRGGVNEVRRHVAAGQQIFNARAFTVTTPTGSFSQTCSGCHSVPNVGAHPVFRLFDVGVSAPERRAANVPLYTFRNKTTGETIQSTDPGRALITGLWDDMNRFKVPGLRDLAARPPYFHDGSAATLRDVVEHYNRHFNIHLSDQEKDDLVLFLEST
jgi:cytochrome c peroxidase